MMAELLFLLIAVHALCDYPLQGDFLSRGKDRNNTTISAIMGRSFWIHAMTAHSLIHGGAVAIITGIWWLGLFETICHWMIDYGKCQGRYGIHTDQALHILCKFIWAYLTVGNFT